MDLCGTPAQISTQDEHWPFKTILLFLSKILIISPQIPFWYSLKISPSCHTLSRALDISMNIPWTLSSISKAVKISWLIERSWLMQVSPGLNTNWFEESRLFSEKIKHSVINTGLVSSRLGLTSWGEGTSLALVGHPSSDDIMIKIPYGVDVLLRWPASYPIFSYCVG